MGGVDRLNQLRKTYGFDRKSRRYWIRPFFQFFDYAIKNAYLLYKHNCKTFKMNLFTSIRIARARKGV